MKLNIAINVIGNHLIGTGHSYRQITLSEEYPMFNFYFYIDNYQILAEKILKENLIFYEKYINNDDFIIYKNI